mgnify:CR=1 FL=1
MLIETILSISSFVLSLGGFLLSWISFRKTKDKIFVGIAVILAVLMLSSGIVLLKQAQKKKRVKNIEVRIVKTIGSEAKSAQELYEKLLPFVEYKLFNEALEQLISEGRVEDRVIQVRDHYDREFRIRVYYMPNNPLQPTANSGG